MWAENLIVMLEKKSPRSSQPYHRQVFAQVRGAILDGTLAPGDRLPATRELALSLGLARNTVARAYEDLLAGGYLEGRIGSGTFVSAGIGALPRASAQRKSRTAAPGNGPSSGRAAPARWHDELPGSHLDRFPSRHL